MKGISHHVKLRSDIEYHSVVKIPPSPPTSKVTISPNVTAPKTQEPDESNWTNRKYFKVTPKRQQKPIPISIIGSGVDHNNTVLSLSVVYHGAFHTCESMKSFVSFCQFASNGFPKVAVLGSPNSKSSGACYLENFIGPGLSCISVVFRAGVIVLVCFIVSLTNPVRRS